MEISRQTSGDLIILHLAGRLDANWCNHVESALSAAVREGEHRLHLDMSAVGYISSAGIRVLLTCYKQLRAINGLFGVIRPSEAVRSVLELSGLQMLITSEIAASTTTDDDGKKLASPSGAYELFTLGAGGMKIQAVGDPALLAHGSSVQPVTRRFDSSTVALGIGALGGNFAESAARCGELLAVEGVAAFQPADGSSRPDFMLSEGALVPEGHLVLGLSAKGTFTSLLRFEANDEDRRIGITELMQTALEASGANAAVVVAVTETAGLVGATLRQSPTSNAGAEDERFRFPQIREWLSFTSERSFRDTTSLIVGVIAKPGTAFDALLRPLASGTAFDALLRPLASGTALIGHLHAAVFPYRPLRKGRIDLKPAVTSLFDGQSLQSVLHLICDPRGFNGAGESELYRGAVWIAPITN